MTTREYRIRRLEPGDIPAILQIQEEQDIRKKDTTRAEKEGFLVSLMNENEIKNFLKANDREIHVYDEGRGVEAYLAVYLVSSWIDEHPEFLKVKLDKRYERILTSDRLIYVRHIAKRIGASGLSVLELESQKYCEFAQGGYNQIIGEIAIKTPLNIPNNPSLRFHQRLGFKQIGIREEEKYTWATMFKEIKDDIGKNGS